MQNGKVDKYLFSGGYCQNTDSNLAFNYFNQDHLGNIREVVDSNGKVVQTNNYYPFGTPFYDEANTTNASLQPFKYNGKELDMMHGLNTYDYGARQYYSALPVWDRVDPLCEKDYGTSPYVYCTNNPVNKFDPDGREVIDGLSVKNNREETIKQNFISKLHDNPNCIIVFVHGSNNGNGVNLSLDNSTIYMVQNNESSLFTLDMFWEENSNVWNQKNVNEAPTEIVLFSCETGKKGGLAQFESSRAEMNNISIFAPSDNVNIHSDGSVYIDNEGVWREFVNGEIVNEYPGNFMPGTVEFNNLNFWEKLVLPQFNNIYTTSYENNK